MKAVKQLAKKHSGVELYHHVDDMSNMIAATTTSSAIMKARRYAIDFKHHMDELKIDMSPRSAILPNNVETENFVKGTKNRDISLKVQGEGVDICVDSSSGTRRGRQRRSIY